MRAHPGDSIFIKLLVAYGVALVLKGGGAIAARILSASSPNLEMSVTNVRFYVEMIVDTIGVPPDLEVANHIVMETGLDIVILGPDLEWSSDEELLNRAMQDGGNEISERVPFKELGDYLIESRRGRYRYCFSEFHADHRFTMLMWLFMSLVILLALTVSYAMVRHLLKPLRQMSRVARELGVNDWKQRVNPKGWDELASLGRTMDSMADRIERYIKSMHDLLIAISHELRSPLTRMKMTLEFIEDQRIKASLDEEIRALDRITGALLEQRRLLTQPGSLRLEPVELHSWIASVCAPYQGADLPVILEVTGKNRTVSLDRARMDMAVRNLIENALRHAPSSPVTIRLIPTGRAKETGFNIEVADQGPGMPESLLERIGEPFLLADASRSGQRKDGGFGLGLSIVRAIAEAHGATFSVRNLSPHGFAATLSFSAP